MFALILPITRNLIVLDVETSDFEPPEKTRIIELGFHIEYPDGREPFEYQTFFNPGVMISEEATAKHHITNQMIMGCRKCGKLPEEHIPVELMPEISEEEKGCEGYRSWPKFEHLAENFAKGFADCDYCAYSGRFDLRCVGSEMARAGVPWSVGDARLVDPLHLWRLQEPRTLEDAVEKFLHRKPSGAHRALHDVRDTFEVMQAQLIKWPGLPRDAAQLHDLCFDKDNVDPDGKFRWVDGVVTCNFGKHKFLTLEKMPRQYRQWMVDSGDFSAETKALVRDSLLGVYPTQPVRSEPVESEE